MKRRRRHSLLYVVYLRSPLWRARRWIWIVQARGRCQECGRRRWLTIHHLTYKRLGHERRSDVAVLCWPCHQARHSHDRGPRGRAPLAPVGLLGRSRRTVRTLRVLLLLAGLGLVVHVAPALLTLIPGHR